MMNTRYIAAEYRLAHWAQIIKERSESNMTIKAFCENAGIHENTYYHWQRKLREAACTQLSIQSETIKPALAQGSFAEVKLYDNQDSQLQTGEELRGNLHIEVSGIKITTDSAYPIEQLSHLLKGLVQQC